MEIQRKMDWGGENSCGTDACSLVAAASKPSKKKAYAKTVLQQNLGSDRENLSDSINNTHSRLSVKRERLDEKVQTYLEFHNSYMEKQADLIAVADSPGSFDEEGRVVGWDKLASDSSSKRVGHSLDSMESATTIQLEHAKELLAEVVKHDKLCQSEYRSMEGFAQGYEDFEEAVSHSMNMCRQGLARLLHTLTTHVADHKRFISRIGNARRAVARGMTASAAMEEFYNKNHQQSGADGGQFVEGPDGPGRVRDEGTEDLGKSGTNEPNVKKAAGGGGGGGVGTKGNPIKTDNIEVAAQALADGKHVELKQPDQVSTLLDKLHTMVIDAESRGEKAPTYNLCNVSVPGTNVFCHGNKNIPRVRMPQLVSKTPVPGSKADELDRNEWGEVSIADGFVEAMEARGVKVEDVSVVASHLRASQNEMNGKKVASLLQKLKGGGAAPGTVWVSSDGYVIDGHHNMAAQIAYDAQDNKLGDIKINVRRVDMPILEVLAAAKNYATSNGIPTAGI